MFKFLNFSFFNVFKRAAANAAIEGAGTAVPVNSKSPGDFALRFSGVRYNGSRYNGGRYTGGRYCRRS